VQKKAEIGGHSKFWSNALLAWLYREAHPAPANASAGRRLKPDKAAWRTRRQANATTGERGGRRALDPAKACISAPQPATSSR